MHFCAQNFRAACTEGWGNLPLVVVMINLTFSRSFIHPGDWDGGAIIRITRIQILTCLSTAGAPISPEAYLLPMVYFKVVHALTASRLREPMDAAGPGWSDPIRRPDLNFDRTVVT